MLSTFVLFYIMQLLSSAVFQVESASTHPFVVNGVDVTFKDYPHAAAIYYSGDLLCGGTIIGEFSILALSGCCDTTGTIKVGATDLSDAKSFQIDSCNNVAIHDDSNNAAAVIQVNESLYKAGGKAVKLVQEKDIGEFMNKEGIVVGWGQTSGDGVSSNSEHQLKRGDVKIMSVDDLKKLGEEKYPSMDRDIDVDERYFTVGFSEKELPFFGDFGGALTVETAEGIVAIGSFAVFNYQVSPADSTTLAFGWSIYNNFGHQRREIDSYVSDVEWYEAKTIEVPKRTKAPESTKTAEPTKNPDPSEDPQEIKTPEPKQDPQVKKTSEPTTPKPTSGASQSGSIFLALSFAVCSVACLF